MSSNAGEKTVDVRIGVHHTPKEIEVELPNGTTKDAVQKEIDRVLSDDSKVLWLTDKKGRKIGVPARAIAYVELGAETGERRMGFIG